MSRIASTRQRTDLGLVAASLVGAALVVASLLVLVMIRVGQTRAGYAVHDLRAERARLAQERAALDVEKASLLRPARLTHWARAEAGLAPVAPTQVLAARATSDGDAAAANSAAGGAP